MAQVRRTDSARIDELDQKLIRALHLAPRAPFSQLAEVLAVSEQTVARRYRRLRNDGVMRIVGMVDSQALGEAIWLVRVRCRPDGVNAIADALARRDDVGWVMISAGGSEVSCSVRSRTREQRDDLLAHRLPRSAAVLGIDVAIVLHRFPGTALDDWTVYSEVLTGSQVRALDGPAPAPAAAVSLEPADEPLLELLGRDGRAGYAELAAAAGISEARAARRVSALLDSGLVYLDVDLAARQLGFTAQAALWLTVTPAQLRAAGTALVGLTEVAFAAAVTGRANLQAVVVCRDTDALYTFVTDRIGAIAGVQAVEVSPVQRVVKQAGALTDGSRLTPPAPPPSPPARRVRR